MTQHTHLNNLLTIEDGMGTPPTPLKHVEPVIKRDARV